ncbi:MAG: hypothetical protein U1F35_02620 [Steroidobacteraceae bacterium]
MKQQQHRWLSVDDPACPSVHDGAGARGAARWALLAFPPAIAPDADTRQPERGRRLNI